MAKDNALSISNNEPLNVLKQFTSARIALGSTGTSLPLKANLDFQLAHALARDAVSIPLDFECLTQQLSDNCPTIQLQSQVTSHAEYLQRPDMGRLLSLMSIEKLQNRDIQIDNPDIAIIVVDGLSSKAITNHAPALLKLLIPQLYRLTYTIAPVCLVKYGRVAIGDPVGELINARMSIVLIGERPGLSSPDSMGIYFTYQPKTGNSDAQRNCISNIHSEGLSYQVAINKLLFLVNEAIHLKYSGVQLKDTSDEDQLLDNHAQQSNFLLE